MGTGGSRRIEDRLARRGGVVELLRIPAALFGVVSTLRGALYARGWLPSDKLEVPVVSVGNLTAGGTGKTPMVSWVVRALVARGLRPGIVSRGYGTARGEDNDEARALALELPGIPHVQDPDRARGARTLGTSADVVVLDDAFQHRRLARDLDLVLLDATRPWGFPPEPERGAEDLGAFLPRGLLRESPRALARAQAVCLTRTDQVAESALEQLERRVLELAPGVPVLHSQHRPRRLRCARDGSSVELGDLAGRTVDLVSGIGNPAAFEATVRALGAEVAEHRRFPDHHAFVPADLAGLGAEGRWVVATAKDAVKLEGASPELHVLEVELALTQGEQVLEALLDALPVSRAALERRALHGGLYG